MLGVGDDVGFDVVDVLVSFDGVVPLAVIERSSLRRRRQQRVRLRDELLRDEGAHDSVDLVEQVPHPLVRLRGGVSHLDDEPIELVEHEAHLQAFLPSLPEHRVGLHADALDHVHHHEPSVAEASRGGDLAAEVDVPRGVDEVDEQGFRLCLVPAHGAFRGVKQGYRGALHGDAPSLLVVQEVHEPQLPRELLTDEPIVGYEAVGERGLAVVNVCEDAYVPYVVGELLQPRQTLDRLLHPAGGVVLSDFSKPLFANQVEQAESD